MVETTNNIGWSRAEMAKKTALDIPDGSYVNLGIGIPEMVADFVPEGRELIYQTENGLLGMGPIPEVGKGDRELVNAGKKYVTTIPGAAYFHLFQVYFLINLQLFDRAVMKHLHSTSQVHLKDIFCQCFFDAFQLVSGLTLSIISSSH